MSSPNTPRLSDAQRDAFKSWLADELSIHDAETREGLWQAVVFSTAWLDVDNQTRPRKAASKTHIAALRQAIATLKPPLGEPFELINPAERDTADLLRGLDAMYTSSQGLSEIQAQLTRYDALLERIELAIERRPVGRPRDSVLWDWVADLSAIWSLLTKLPVSIDYHVGEPITPYARFMHRAVELLDPSRLDALPNALRRNRTAQNRARKHNSIER